MFEKFTAAGAQDFKQRYAGTYGFFRDKDTKILCLLSKISVDDRRPFVEFSDRDGMNYKLLSDSTEEQRGFEFLTPKSSYYNIKAGTPLLIKRIPARQYQRGICDRNTNIELLTGNQVGVGFSSLISIFEDKVSVSEALKLGLESRLKGAGIAVSSQFAVCFGNGTLYCLGAPIGKAKFEDGKFTITLTNPELFGTEVTDAFRRANFVMELK